MTMKTWITIAAVMLPALAGATGDRIVVLCPSGAPHVREQLVETLCVSEDCVAPEKVLSAGKLDWGKVSREKVTSVVAGKAMPNKKAGPELELTVMEKGGKAKRSQTLPLNDDNKLSVKDLVTASAVALGNIDNGICGKGKAEPKSKHEAKSAKLAHHGKAKATRKIALRPHQGSSRG